MNRISQLLLFLSLLFCQCQNKGETSETQIRSRVLEGETLAKQYCASCHLFPTPDQLDKATWTNQTLPNMAARMGLRVGNYDPFEGVEADELLALKTLKVYPETPLIDESEWQKIVEYYQRLSPEKLPAQERDMPITYDSSPFLVEQIKFGKKEVPQVTLLEFDPVEKTIFIGDNTQLFAFDQGLKTVGSWQLQSPSSDIAITKDGIMVLSIGEFSPSEKKEGVFFPLTLNNGQPTENYVVTELQRPVHFSIGDLNEDDQADLVISSFGNHQGQLAWYDRYDQNKVSVLSSLPGARKAEIVDLNRDGKNDIVALFAQAWEKLVVFYNLGDGQFEETTLISFPAVHGSCYFELIDFNQDGHPDLLMTNGDNWDYSNVPKPYHGVRIYLNDGKNQFSESYFFPLYGCNEARAVDFDKDGDLDIAAIAFYSEQPAEGFVYLENEGQMNFTEYFINETACGKWLTMDVGDFNNDGYQDIFLGSYFHNANELVKLMSAGIEDFPEVLLLTYKK